MFGSIAPGADGGLQFASLELLLQAAEIIQREEAGDAQLVPACSTRIAKPLAYDSTTSAGSETDDSDGAVPSRSSQSKPYKRPNTKRRQQQAKQYKAAQTSKAEQHNEVEKRRRAYLSHCYTALKVAVPGLATSKASNVTVLRSAVAEIKQLEERGRALEAAKAEQAKLRQTLLNKLPAEYAHKFASSPVPSTSEAYDSEDGAAVPDSYECSVSDTELDAQDVAVSRVFSSAEYTKDAAVPIKQPAARTYVLPLGRSYAQTRGGGPRRRRAQVA